MRPVNYLMNMDKNALRSMVFMLAIFSVMIFLILFGRFYLGLDNHDIALWLQQFASSPLGLFIVMLTFIAGALVGVPQWMLIAAVIVTFGPKTGSIYAWLSTLLSAGLTFYLGRMLGPERLTRLGGSLVEKIVAMIRRNGFLVSMTIRMVPTGPFVLVNMAAGVSGMRAPVFLAGSSIGVIPKIVIVAMITEGVISGAQGDYMKMGVIVVAVLLIVILLMVRRKLRSVILSSAETEHE